MINENLLIDKQGLLAICPGLSKHSLDWLIRKRRIPIVKIGRRIFFNQTEIEKWIDSMKIEPI